MFAVIMAGGKGTRFWPRSREKMPKHLLDILGERTILRETVDRIRPIVPAERTLVVTGRSHAAEVIRQLPEIPPENILIEPVGRNTAPCIGLAALHILKRIPDEVMLVLPSDHRIGDDAAFRRISRRLRGRPSTAIPSSPSASGRPGLKRGTATSSRAIPPRASGMTGSTGSGPSGRSRPGKRRSDTWRRAGSPGTAGCSSGRPRRS